jgi:putative FmdB family regulatory protein
MPIYEHECARCGRLELERRMSDPAPVKCPRCGRAGLTRIYSAHFHGAVDAGQENENDGLGMWYPEMGARYLDPHTKTKRNPAAYARTRYEAMEKLKRRGYGVEKA